MAANGAWLVQSEHVATASAVCAAMSWNGIAPRIKVVSSTAAHLIVNTPSVFKSSFAFSLFSVPEGHLTAEELQRWLSHTSAVILGMGSAFGNQKSMAVVTTSSLGCDKDVCFAVEMRLNHEISHANVLKRSSLLFMPAGLSQVDSLLGILSLLPRLDTMASECDEYKHCSVLQGEDVIRRILDKIEATRADD